MTRRFIGPSVYLVFALLVWGGFVSGYYRVGAQALANLGLIVAVLPIAMIDILVNIAFVHGDAILNWSDLFHKIGLPQGYLLDHGYYYFPRVLVVTWILYLWQGQRSSRVRRSGES